MSVIRFRVQKYASLYVLIRSLKTRIGWVQSVQWPEQVFSSSSPSSDGAAGRPLPLFNAYRWRFPREESGRSVTVSTRLQPEGSSARRTNDLLKLNRDQLRWVVGLLTGHSPKRTPFQIGIDC
jgi:hypothetical protein